LGCCLGGRCMGVLKGKETFGDKQPWGGKLLSVTFLELFLHDSI
jgi:hypothetical protein